MPTFDDVVMQTMDEVVRNVFEDDIAETIFRCMKGRGVEQVDDRVRTFADSLLKILGTGSVIIEDLILETLYSKFGSELQWKKDYRFTDYVIELRNRTERGESE